ncbi:hypothetical protein [Jeongeupia naejangsanensis]|uniref:Flagellar protein FliT n=1 Tax=Jeongeupia naejangsanensis TaxID=613195 RepID=A0ABS2BGH7_9NEIS|nr:hypothetical protein [Jeongeupia naejangsanensis]MBM3114714.1 hypothetical protein [Jeongeupia naejangsanensis]
MDKALQILTLTRALLDVQTRRDWAQLAEVDKALSVLVGQLNDKVHLSLREREALKPLRVAHAAAMKSCLGEAGRMNALLDELRRNREGLIAYGLINEQDDRP